MIFNKRTVGEKIKNIKTHEILTQAVSKYSEIFPKQEDDTVKAKEKEKKLTEAKEGDIA